MDQVIQTQRPAKLARLGLGGVEVLAWLWCVVFLIVAVGVMVEGAGGDLTVSAQLVDVERLATANGHVEGGLVDVRLAQVPLDISWPYVLTVFLAGLLLATIGVVVALLARGVRRGTLFAAITPRRLYAFAGGWTLLALARPWVLATTQSRMAESVDAQLPGFTFDYTVMVEDVLVILVTPIVIMVVAIFASGSKMWAEHKSLV